MGSKTNGEGRGIRSADLFAVLQHGVLLVLAHQACGLTLPLRTSSKMTNSAGKKIKLAAVPSTIVIAINRPKVAVGTNSLCASTPKPTTNAQVASVTATPVFPAAA